MKTNIVFDFLFEKILLMVDLCSIHVYFEVCSICCWIKMGRGESELVYVCFLKDSISYALLYIWN